MPLIPVRFIRERKVLLDLAVRQKFPDRARDFAAEQRALLVECENSTGSVQPARISQPPCRQQPGDLPSRLVGVVPLESRSGNAVSERPGRRGNALFRGGWFHSRWRRP